ncbi:MAG: endonuclease/exonuclease/phosphatase family protein, partial [Nocardiopsaceae bacterium]|nr:endonuclease/exonuclease/phosphatase family protein [Nocardiopsaceae bacterium]
AGRRAVPRNKETLVATDELWMSYINYAHSGRTGGSMFWGGGDYDFSGLVRIMDDGSPWPAILGFGEANRWDDNGYEAGYAACAALSDAGGPPYQFLLGARPGQTDVPWGLALLYDPRVVRVHHWYGDPRLHHFNEERHSGQAVISRVGSQERWRVMVTHSSWIAGRRRLEEAELFVRLAAPETPCVIVGDFNATLSGPQWEVGDFTPDPSAPGRHRPDRAFHKIKYRPGQERDDPPVGDTDGLDLLCGRWVEGTDGAPGHREGGVGFFDVAELAQDFTPTQYEVPGGRRPRCIDRALVNAPFADAYVPGSYRVHEPTDPERPGSDHKRISFALHV